MTIEILKSSINGIINSEFGLEAYAVVKNGDMFDYQFMNIDERLMSKLMNELKGQLNTIFINNTLNIKGISDIADNQSDTYYEFTKRNDFIGLDFLFDSYTVLNGNQNRIFKISTNAKILGFIFKIGYDENIILIYQHFYPTSQIKIGSSIVLTEGENNDGITDIKKDMIRLTKNIDILCINDIILSSNIKLIQRSFGFNMYILQESSKVIEVLKKIDAIDGFDKIENYSVNLKNLSKLKKIMQAKKSPVLELSAKELVDSVSSHERYKNKFIIKNGRICIKNNGDVEALIQLLLDGILISQITKREYETDVKTMLP